MRGLLGALLGGREMPERISPPPLAGRCRCEAGVVLSRYAHCLFLLSFFRRCGDVSFDVRRYRYNNYAASSLNTLARLDPTANHPLLTLAPLRPM